MLDAGSNHPRHRRLAQTEPTRGLAAEGPPADSDLGADGAIAAAIIGRPRWTEQELRELAGQHGHARAVAEAYRRFGTDFFQCLRGAFALAVFDSSLGKAIVAIDRFGIHRLCYLRPVSGGLVFATTTDGVRAHPSASCAVSPQSIYNFIYFGVCPSPRTIYLEQAKLLPAQYAVYENDTVRTEFYWRMPYRGQSEKKPGDLSQELVERLRSAVSQIASVADAPRLGAFLSGGLDSSTVSGLLSEVTHGRAKTFTIGFSDREFDETRYAEIVARHFRTEHRNYYLTAEDVARALVPLATAFDEPFGNSSALPAYYCAKLAYENGVTTMLAGDGGDEIFAGNSRYVDELVFDLYGRIPGWLRHRVLEPLLLPRSRPDDWVLVRKARNYIRRARIPMPERTQAYNFYQNSAPHDVFDASFLARINLLDPLEMMREVYDRTTSPALLHRMLHLDLKLTLADNDLRKVGTACELAGLSVAYPFLDDDVVEFSAQVPVDLLIRRFQKRWFFKHAFKDFLPPATLAKRKHGFGMPFAQWPRTDPRLREIANDCLASLRPRRLLRSDFLDRLIGDRPGSELDGLVWDLMMLEMWLTDRRVGTG